MSSFARSLPLSNLNTGGVKSFGLQLPAAKQSKSGNTNSVILPKPKPFQIDEDDDDEGEKEARDRAKFHPLQLDTIRSKRYASDAARVLAEDPHAFDYDEVYESEVAPKKTAPTSQVQRLGLGGNRMADRIDAAPTPASAPAAPSRYIHALLSKSAQRKLEHEAVYERNLLKDRAKEDEEYADKQKFMTSAYKEQLAAQAAIRAAQEEQDRRDEAMEEAKRRNGGKLLNTSLALSVSRGVLEGITNRGPKDTVIEPSHTTTPHNVTIHSAQNLTADSHQRNLPSKHSRSDRHDESEYEEDRIADSKRHKSSEPTSTKSKGFDFSSEATSASSTLPDPDTSTSTSFPSSSSSSSSFSTPVSASIHAKAVSIVLAQLTEGRDRVGKAEAARTRLQARREAATATAAAAKQ